MQGKGDREIAGELSLILIFHLNKTVTIQFLDTAQLVIQVVHNVVQSHWSSKYLYVATCRVNLICVKLA